MIFLRLAVGLFASLCIAKMDVSTPPGLQLQPPRENAAAVGVSDAFGNPLVVVVGGETGAMNNNQALDELVVFDLLKNSQFKYKLPISRDDPDVGVVGDLVLIAGGNNGSNVELAATRNTIDIFNVTSLKFESNPHVISQARKWMDVACTKFVCAFIGGTVQSGSSSTQSKTVDAFDVRTRAWSSFDLMTFREGSAALAAVALGDKVYVTGGGLTPSERRYVVEVIDFSSTSGDQWKSTIDTSSLTVSLYDHCGVRGGNYVIFAGGIFRNMTEAAVVATQKQDKCLMRLPDPTPSWQLKPFGGSLFAYEDGLYEALGVSLGDYAIIVGGREDFLGGNGTNFMFVFDPNTASNSNGGWTRYETLLQDEVYHHGLASVVYGTVGYVVVIGGRDKTTGVHGRVTVVTFTNDANIKSQCASCAGTCVAPNRCIIAPPPTEATKSSTMLSTIDGSSTSTSTPKDTLVVTTSLTKTSASSAATSAPASQQSNDVLPIVLGTVGGVVLLAAVIVMLLLVLKKRKAAASAESLYYSNTQRLNPVSGTATPAVDNSYTTHGYGGENSSAGYISQGYGGSSSTGYEGATSTRSELERKPQF